VLPQLVVGPGTLVVRGEEIGPQREAGVEGAGGRSSHQAAVPLPPAHPTGRQAP
jgi:hypothetical protein